MEESKETKKEKKIEITKTPEEIKKQDYINACELQKLIPGLGYDSSLTIIKDIRKEMKDKKLFVPKVRPYVALTKFVKKKFGL